MSRQKKQGFEDDGRVIADMNVEGMPWNLSGPLKPSLQKVQPTKMPLEDITLSKKERRALIQGALAVVLPITMIVALAYFGIFLFLDLVWLR